MALSLPLSPLPHISNSCHVNSVLTLLSSLAYIKKHIREPLLYQILTQQPYLMKSPLSVLTSFCNMYDISYINPCDANDTLKKILHKTNIPKNILLYLDCSDELLSSIDRKLSFSDLIHKYHPIYIITNSQDFQIVTDSDKIQYDFTILVNNKPDVSYSLRGAVLYNGAHYTTFIEDSLYNDLYRQIIKTNNASGFPSIYLYVRK